MLPGTPYKSVYRKPESNASQSSVRQVQPSKGIKMVAETQQLQSCEEDAPSVTSANKKARPTTPLNLYRPPALRKRIEELEVSSRNAEPDEPDVPKAERVRPAKQRRPDLQVYVPRAKRILATPEDKSKGAATILPVQSESRTSVSKKNDKKESQLTRTRIKTKSSESVSSGLLSRGMCGDKNSSRQVSGGKSASKERRNSFESPDTCSEIVQKCEAEKLGEALVTCSKNFDVSVDHKVSKDLNEPIGENYGKSLLSLSESNASEVECDVQIENNDCLMRDESSTDFDSSFCTECENEMPQDLNNSYKGEFCCTNCCKISRLCQCNSVDLISSVNESSELSTCSADSVLPANISDAGHIEATGTTCLEGDFVSICNFVHECEELLPVSDENEIEVKANNSSECNSVLRKMTLEESEENANVDNFCSNSTDHAEDKPLLEEIHLSDDNKKQLENENLPNENVSADKTNISDSLDNTAVSDVMLDRRKSGVDIDDADKLISIEKDKQSDTMESSNEESVPKTTAPIRLNPDECTWDMMFDENGDCLDPRLIEEITKAVGSVKIEKPKSDYNNYQNKPEIHLDPNDELSHVVELYNFPSAFKTEDLVRIFSPYRNGGFEIKWVDNTHALGVFSSAFVAAEVLAAEHPFVKTRPLREASHESRMKAKRSAEFLQPYRERPETCAALARRLVTGALGVKSNTSREVREAERRLLREAREKKRLAAKQREDIWEGTFSAD